MKEKVLSVVEGIKEFIEIMDKFGVFKILKAAFILCACIVLIKGAIYLDPEKLLIKLQDIETKQAEDVRQFRKESDVTINLELTHLMDHLDADRISVMEFHNGKSNSTGLGFYYADMSYEKVSRESGLPSVVDQWENANLSWLSIDDTLYHSGYWYGDIDALISADKLVGERMRSNGVGWTCFYLLEYIEDDGESNEIGILCVSYKDIPSEEVQKEVGRSVRKIAPKLTACLYYKK